MLRRLKSLAALFLAATLGSAIAQATLPMERPSFKAGDTWTYRSVDNWTGKETGRNTSTFGGMEGENWVFRNEDLSTHEKVTRVLNQDLQPCRSMRDSQALVCAGSFKFPMGEDYRHAFKGLPWTNGDGRFDAECEGKGLETVQTPAGPFEAFKVQCKGTWTRVFNGNAQGRYEETAWYAPSVKRPVRHEFNTWRANGQPDTKNLSELVEFKLAP